MTRRRRGSGQNKYGAVRTEVDGIVFASKREAKRYQELRLLEKAGQIRNIRCQVPFTLNACPHGYHERRRIVDNAEDGPCVGKYVADFCYEECPGGLRWVGVTEDAKGFRTPMYRWKAKHMKAQYGIEIREV